MQMKHKVLRRPTAFRGPHDFPHAWSQTTRRVAFRHDADRSFPMSHESHLTDEPPVTRAALDGVALKPREHDLARATAMPVGVLNVDYEGRDAFPGDDTLATLAADHELRVTTPVRADGFDPRGDDSLLPLAAGARVLVAGNPAYLTDAELQRAIAPRLGDAIARTSDAWVGSEGIERTALATGATQYELLGRTTERDLRALRAAGFEGEIALYAPVVFGDDDAALDAVGGYAARRGPVRRALPDGAVTDASATGRSREVLTEAVHDYALVGTPEGVREQVEQLRVAGADLVVGYPAQGLDAFLG